MKKIISLFLVACLVLAALGALTSCELLFPPEEEGPKKLGTPTVALAGDVATWGRIEGAVGYDISVGIQIIHADENTFSHTLKEGESIRVRAVGDGESYKTGDWSKPLKYGSSPDGGDIDKPDEREQLAAPVLTLVDNFANWGSVPGADGYEISINMGSSIVAADVVGIMLDDGDYIIVRALDSTGAHKTSDWSNMVRYFAPVIDECTNHTDSDGDGKCDSCDTPVENKPDDGGDDECTNHTDSDGDGKCDSCDTPVESKPDDGGDDECTNHTDNDGDGKCDSCDTPVENKPDDGGGDECTNHTDNDGDGKCDSCDTPVESKPDDEECIAHKDADDNGSCDVCYESVIVVIDIYAINDLHGKFCDTDTQPGVDELAGYFDAMAEIDDHTILLSSGDMWQGTAESSLTYGRIITEWMNSIGIVSMTLGNHEYDWGEEYIVNNLEVANFPFLAINVYDNDTGKRVDYCKPSVMVERGDIQIGIIGAIGDCYSSILAEMVAGVHFKVGSELTRLVKDEAMKLKAAGADLIVYSLHDGEGGYDAAALSGDYIDIVFEGHTHQAYVTTDGYGVYHLQGGGENRGITHAEIGVNSVTGTKSVSEAEIVYSSAYSRYPDDPDTLAIAEKYADVIEKATKPLGRVDNALDDYALEELVAKLYYEAADKLFGDKYEITIGGGFLRTRSPYDLHSGIVSYSDLLSLLPFNNQLVVCSISGSNLISRFINNTSSDYHVYPKLDASKIDRSRTYYILVDTYTSSYASNRLTEVERYDAELYARDLVADYIKEGNLTVNHTSYNTTPVSELLSIGATLGENKSSAEKYYVKGTVTAIETGNGLIYGNLYLTDDNGDMIYVYGLNDLDGNNYGAMTSPPQVGDEIIIYSVVYNYVNANYPSSSKIELKAATLIEIL